MRLSSFIVAVLVGLAIAPVASAVRLVTPTGTPVGGVWQHWANHSRVPTVRETITFVAFRGDGMEYCGEPALGCSSPAFPGVLPFIATTVGDRFSFYHELGHEFDWTYLTLTLRARFLRLMGEPHVPWVEGGSADDFADLYATCALGYGTHRAPFNENGGWPIVPSLARLNDVCRLIVRLGD